MTDKKLTDGEITKAIACCSELCCECEECPLYCVGVNCSSFELHRYALELIGRQKAEIEKLNIQLRELWNMASLYKAEGERWEGYNKNLLTANTALSNEILSAKAEAYKEFAKEINEEINKAYDNNSSVLREHLEKHKEKPDFELVAAIQGKMNTLCGLNDFIDNLLKEMVGEKE